MSVFCEAAERQNEIIKNKTMTRKAHELVFISQIERDGSGTKTVNEDYKKSMLENPLLRDDDFKINILSLSEETYIAFNFNVFVVKLKN